MSSGGLPSPRPDQAWQPGPQRVIAPGGAAGVFRGRLVELTGGGPPGSGFFAYSPSPGPGNLIYSIATATTYSPGTPVGKDQYGNAVQAGATSYFPAGGGQVQAVQVADGLVNILYSPSYSQMTSWTQLGTLDGGIAASGPVELRSLLQGVQLSLASAGTSASPGAGGAGTVIDGLWYGGQAVHYSSGEINSIASSTALTPDPTLQDTGLPVNAVYKVEADIYYDGAAGAGFLQWEFALANTLGNYVATFYSTTNVLTQQVCAWNTAYQAYTNGQGAATTEVVSIRGFAYLQAAATGAWAFDWAQGASNATATRVKYPSWVRFTRMS